MAVACLDTSVADSIGLCSELATAVEFWQSLKRATQSPTRA